MTPLKKRANLKTTKSLARSRDKKFFSLADQNNAEYVFCRFFELENVGSSYDRQGNRRGYR